MNVIVSTEDAVSSNTIVLEENVGSKRGAIHTEELHSNADKHSKKLTKSAAQSNKINILPKVKEITPQNIPAASAEPLKTHEPAQEEDAVANYRKIMYMLDIMDENEFARRRNSCLKENQPWIPLKRQVAQDASGVGPALGDLPDFEIPLRGAAGKKLRTKKNLQRLSKFYGNHFHSWDEFFCSLKW